MLKAQDYKVNGERVVPPPRMVLPQAFPSGALPLAGCFVGAGRRTGLRGAVRSRGSGPHRGVRTS
ncbi:hypothetical protein SBRY_60367 [Actinacidiphila bryophytorum]|uniref:Uncharacterized protein n=1 Tax=Actinacidiphila bryophytorum TaxID=1436133 RepID=A0A9W4MJD2_9ACTN|nr:hypothetical protein SBRY_60367 [Actinacidiphila bryophytorum]